MELNFIEMRDRVVNMKREIEDIDRFEEREMKKKNAQYDWLINYIPKFIRKSVSNLKDKIISLYNADKPKQNVYGTGQKLSKQRKQNIKKL